MENRILTELDPVITFILKAPLLNNKAFSGMHEYLAAAVKDDNWLWHLRFGHLNYISLNEPSKKKMVHELPVLNQPHRLYEACMLGKQHRRPFGKYIADRTSDLIKLVHSYVSGPIKSQSLGKNTYFFIFIDDFSGKI